MCRSIFLIFLTVASNLWNTIVSNSLPSIENYWQNQQSDAEKVTSTFCYDNIRYSNEPPSFAEYDFIIVGAGAAGSVLANRLSEVPEWSVLLLEAGGQEENLFVDIPGTTNHWPLTHLNWGYGAESTGDMCLGMEDMRCPVPRGKGLGGSTLFNGMTYTRGDQKDYDDYAAAGNTGWGYKDVLPYFLKAENNTIPEYQTSPYHGHNGFMNVERLRYKDPLVENVFLDGAKELGYPITDYTEPFQHGFSKVQILGKQGRRFTSSKAYLGPVGCRKNLHIHVNAQVTKVLINSRTKAAYGVEYSRQGPGYERTVRARKEVILSAGSFNSAHLLLLSGIGPKEHLTQIGIPVIQDLNVGGQMQEHFSYMGLMFLVNTTGATSNSDRINLNTYLEWFYNGTGALTNPGTEGLGYIKSRYANDGPPDVEVLFSSGSFASDKGTDFRRSYGITESVYEQMFKIGEGRDTISLEPMLLYSKSEGRVQLRDKSPWSPPKIFYNFLKDEQDAKLMLDAIEKTLQLIETEPFRKINATLSPSTTLRECSHHAYKSEKYWTCMMKYVTGVHHHAVGACKMGPSSDPKAVVDPTLRVYGIKSLRVVDVSIFPKIPGAHLEAPALMLAEKASDMIKQMWYRNSSILPRPQSCGVYSRSPYKLSEIDNEVDSNVQ